ncbi:TIGR03986 family CRISPR-associated RAMP protein [Actinomadura geliboluensis]|uniref:TIGR03986 family type III CRISPR-associated RAMP protein n=1 Tax=Actinomadura geliboluensis TaxID=882440 RepID=UPI00370FC8B1
MATFINPYTFVSLPETIDRAEPAGHHRAVQGNLCGALTVTWSTLTPLLLPNGAPAVSDGRVVIPGSTVKGAIRSLHETLMGGCLRVVDDTFVPVYRQPAVAKGEGWSLGRIRAATRTGRPLTVEVSDRTVWVPVKPLGPALGKKPETGDTIDIAEWAISMTSLERLEADPTGVNSGTGWVVLIGDAGTRGKSKRFFCAAGHLPAKARILDVTVEAWEEYQRLCDGTEDMRRYLQNPDHRDVIGWTSRPVTAPVRWKNEIVGSRRRATGRLWQDDVVWVHVDEATGTVDHLSMAAIWRAPGKGSLGERFPPELHACDNPEDLCVSCRMFGSADTSVADREAGAEQRSYAGHVRFGSAVAEKVTTTTVRLAPMSAPRPGAGQFYLRHHSTEPASYKENLPSAYWGSEHDEGSFRHVRGRKFYWHGDPGAQDPPRHIARSEQRNANMVENRYLVPKGTVFTERIRFDNLSRAELGSLLVTLQPGVLLPRCEGMRSADYALHLGGGKPLGLGSCTVAVTELECWDARDRYAGGQAVHPDPWAYTDSTLPDVARLAAPAARRRWPALSRVLRIDGVDPELLWYPLGGSSTRLRDRSFNFFSRTNGRFLMNGREPIKPLPDPADPDNDQTLEAQ